MADYSLSPEALDDLDVIWGHIAQDNPDAADQVIDAAYEVCRKPGKFPELGPVRPFPGDVPSGMRSFTIPRYPNYIVFCRVADPGVEVVRVLHAARDIDKNFGG